MKAQRITSGSIVRIPIDNEYHTYGRILIRPYVEVFDCRTKDSITDLAMIISQPVLFYVSVYNYTITKGYWEKIGKLPYHENEVAIPESFVQDILDLNKCKLYDAYGNSRPATIEECKGKERLAVWEPEHVEERLRDHYAGRQNPMVERLKVKEL